MNGLPAFLRNLSSTIRTPERKIGTVYLVGAGPGDPELLTLRAAKLLSLADVVVYDHLIGDGILDFSRADSQHIYVGKETNRHTLSQEAISALLVQLAKEGKQVVRLKGGDPFIFGRGGEEIETLAAHGISFQVVPGITAASGVSCYTGIPLTHRDYAQSCIFTTGHLRNGSLDLDWKLLVQPQQTVVIYMGLGALPEISRELIAHGLRADMPAAAIERGTTKLQRIATGTITSLPGIVAAKNFESPCLTIIGEVVSLHDSLQGSDITSPFHAEDDALLN